jgi:hypothetical protein
MVGLVRKRGAASKVVEKFIAAARACRNPPDEGRPALQLDRA